VLRLFEEEPPTKHRELGLQLRDHVRGAMQIAHGQGHRMITGFLTQDARVASVTPWREDSWGA
jgi:hypothetical protein